MIEFNNNNISNIIKVLKSFNFNNNNLFVKVEPTDTWKKQVKHKNLTLKFPFAVNKIANIAVVGSLLDEQIAIDNGIKIVGKNALIEAIDNKSNIDYCICNPNMLDTLEPIYNKLGALNILPSFSKSTLSFDIEKSIKFLQSDVTTIRYKSSNPLYIKIGSLNNDPDHLISNISYLLFTLYGNKFKSNYLKNIYLTSTYCPLIPVEYNINKN